MRLAIAALSLSSLVSAQEVILLRPHVKPDPAAPAEAIQERGTPQLPDRSITNVSSPSITVYLPDASKSNGAALVICPGGGYGHLAIDKEGHEVARWLQSNGYAGIVLKYRLPGAMKGTLDGMREAAEAAKLPMEDAAEAMRIVRANASKWNLRPNAVGMIGFSAGGHLAAMIGYTAPPETRPNFLVLGYPAIPKNVEVGTNPPPTFLAHADDDRLLAGDNSVRLYLALKKAQGVAELHVYANGGHGFGIRKTAATSAGWTEPLKAWLALVTARR